MLQRAPVRQNAGTISPSPSRIAEQSFVLCPGVPPLKGSEEPCKADWATQICESKLKAEGIFSPGKGANLGECLSIPDCFST